VIFGGYAETFPMLSVRHLHMKTPVRSTFPCLSPTAIVPFAEELFEEARKMAKRFASQGAVALRMAKSCVNEGLRMDLEAGLQYEQRCFSILFATEDQKEGMRAFLEKRKPNFQGK